MMWPKRPRDTRDERRDAQVRIPLDHWIEGTPRHHDPAGVGRKTIPRAWYDNPNASIAPAPANWDPRNS